MKTFFLLIIAAGAIFFASTLIKDSQILKNQWYGQDMDQYIDYSNNLLAGHGYSAKAVSNMYYQDPQKNTVYIPEIIRLPAYPLLLTFGRLIYNKPTLLIVYDFVFFGAILLYSALLLKILAPGWLSVPAIAYIGWNATNLFYTGNMAGIDTFVECAMVGFMYHVLVLMKSKKHKTWHTVAATVWGIFTILGRQNTLIYICVFLGLLFLISLRKTMRPLLKYFVIIGLFVFGALGMWIWRNYTVTGKPTISAFSGSFLVGEYVYFTRSPDLESQKIYNMVYVNHFPEQFMQKQRKSGKTIPQAYANYDEYIRGVAINYILHNPGPVWGHYLVAVRAFYTDATFGWPAKDLLSQLMKLEYYVNWILLFFSFLFPLIVFFHKKNLQLAILTIIWFSCFLFIYISAFFHGTTIGNRGFLPVLPLMTILLAAFLQNLLGKLIDTINIRRGNALTDRTAIKADQVLEQDD